MLNLKFLEKTIGIDKEKIKETITSNKDFIKKLLLDQMGNVIAKDGLFSLASKYNGNKYKSLFWFNRDEESDYPFSLDVVDFKALPGNIGRVDLNGSFCTKETFANYGDECKNHLKYKPFYKERSVEEKKLSVVQIEQTIAKDTSNMVISIDEHYLTKIVNATILNGEWDEILKEKGLKWAKQKAFVRLNKSGDRAQLYMDVIYEISPIKGLLIGQTKVRFPIIFDIKTSIEYRKVDHFEEDGVVLKGEALPHIVFTIMDTQIDDQTIKKGVEELGIISSVQEVYKPLRWLVVDKVQEELFQFDEENNSYNKIWKGVELPPLIFPKIRDLHLEKLKHENDGMGRMNLIAPRLSTERF